MKSQQPNSEARKALNPLFRPVEVTDGVLLEGGRKTLLFGGDAGKRYGSTLFRWLDTPRSPTEIAALAAVPADAARKAFAVLEKSGVLWDEGQALALRARPELLSEVIHLERRRQLSDRPPPSIQDALKWRTGTILLITVTPREGLAALLPRLSLPASVHVISPRDVVGRRLTTPGLPVLDLSGMDAKDSLATLSALWESGSRVLLTRGGRNSVTVGPLVDPACTACPQCVWAVLGEEEPLPEAPNGGANFQAAMTTQACFDLTTGTGWYRWGTTAKVFDTTLLSERLVSVSRRIECPNCGIGEDADAVAPLGEIYQYEQQEEGVPELYNTHPAMSDARAAAAKHLQEQARVGDEGTPEDPFGPHPSARAQSLMRLCEAAVGFRATSGFRRQPPSAGGLGTTQLFISVVAAGDAIERRYFRYAAHEQRLVGTGSAAAKGLGPLRQVAGVRLYLVADLSRLRPKYASFSYRLAHADAGAASAYLLAAAAAEGVSLRGTDTVEGIHADLDLDPGCHLPMLALEAEWGDPS